MSDDFTITNSKHHYPIVLIGMASGFYLSSVHSFYDYPIILSGKLEYLKSFWLNFIKEFFKE